VTLPTAFAGELCPDKLMNSGESKVKAFDKVLTLTPTMVKVTDCSFPTPAGPRVASIDDSEIHTVALHAVPPTRAFASGVDGRPKFPAPFIKICALPVDGPFAGCMAEKASDRGNPTRQINRPRPRRTGDRR
jgi:hypothetical protein